MTDWSRLIVEAATAFGTAGFEEDIRKWVVDTVGARLDRCEVDPAGNVLARTWTPGAKGRVLLVTGLDEPGLMATRVEEPDVVRIAPIGPVQAKDLPGEKVHFQSGATGLVDVEAGIEGEAVDFSRLFVILTSGTVRTGEPAVLDSRTAIMGDTAVGGNLPWRAGTAVLAALADRLAGVRYDVTLLFSAQRSVGARAGRLAVFEEAFDWALDVATAPTPPAAGRRSGAVRTGGGPVIRALDRSLIVRPEMKDRLWNLAERLDIPCQPGVKPNDASDGGILAMAGTGLLVGGVDIPIYATRGHLGFVRFTDLEQTLNLLRAILDT
ncbi:MAG: hypothetical protein QJR01_05340 [Kyrpidia sp.]|nr:hypothetical protein [Kyrpidia sp.]